MARAAAPRGPLSTFSLHSPVVASPGPAAPWIDVDAAALRAALGRRAIPLTHQLVGHPLATRDAVVRLAGEIPASWSLPHRAAGLPLLLPARRLPAVDTPADELARGIETNGHRVTMYSLERLAAFQALLDDCLDPVAGMLGDGEGGMRRRGVNVWMSCPDGVVPVHCDRHHNLLLQLEGTKQVGVGFFDDPLVQDREADASFARPARNPTAFPPAAISVALGPGDGVYVPPYAFHWVEGGPEVSVAMSIGFTTATSERAEVVHGWNARMRRLGLTPAPVGTSLRRDRAKEVSARAWQDGRRIAAAGRRRLRTLRS